MFHTIPGAFDEPLLLLLTPPLMAPPPLLRERAEEPLDARRTKAGAPFIVCFYGFPTNSNYIFQYRTKNTKSKYKLKG